jgi:hypothetical protein
MGAMPLHAWNVSRFAGTFAYKLHHGANFRQNLAGEDVVDILQKAQQPPAGTLQYLADVASLLESAPMAR